MIALSQLSSRLTILQRECDIFTSAQKMKSDWEANNSNKEEVRAKANKEVAELYKNMSSKTLIMALNLTTISNQALLITIISSVIMRTLRQIRVSSYVSIILMMKR